jgi:gamma-glutamylcyclotransferase (GGCT)/AIG2-like uncharacterized protein YtfP
MESLFAYGTLMCEDIMRDVAGCLPAHAPATLKGYRRWTVKGEQYPGLAPDPEGRVEGVLYRDVSASAWERLDRFEGEMYARRMVLVELDDGRTVDAEAYIVKPECAGRLEDSEWDLAEFLRNGKAAFRRGYKGYQSINGRIAVYRQGAEDAEESSEM